MHSVKNLALCLLAAAGAVRAASDVVDLKADTFDEFVKENELVLAECKLSAQTPGWRKYPGVPNR